MALNGNDAPREYVWAQTKDSANSLFEGDEVSGKMSVEDMMALIKEVD
jgi:hypothetical protein